MMKSTIRSPFYLFAACSILILSNCKKVSDIKKPPLLDSTIVNAMYPLSVTSQQIGQSTKADVSIYTYDKFNHLIRIAPIDTSETGVLVTAQVFSNIGPHQVDKIVKEYNTNSSGGFDLYKIATRSYVYNLVGIPNTPVDIYNSSPTQVTYTDFIKDVKSGVVSSMPGGQYQFEVNKSGLPTREIYTGANVNFSYDAKGNMQKVEFVNLSGPRANSVFGRFTVTSIDSNLSPFSALKNYWIASFPQSYQLNYAWAFCKNNPKQIISENYDANSNAFVVYQKDDFSYSYNSKGYPVQIIATTTFMGNTSTQSIATYNFTYK